MWVKQCPMKEHSLKGRKRNTNHSFWISSFHPLQKLNRIRDVYLRRHCKWGTFNISMRNLSGMYCMHSNILCVVRQVSYLINKMTASYKSALIKPYTRTLDLLFVMVINFFILHFKRYTSRHLIYINREPY